MSGKVTADTDLMSVSIVAGPAAPSVIKKLDGVTVFEEPPRATPDQIIQVLRAIAEEGETDHLVLPCAEDRPAMAYASLFADPSTGLSQLAQLKRVAFVIDATTLLDALLDRKRTAASAIFLAEQIEFVTHVLLDGGFANGDLDLARSVVATLNPNARIDSLSATVGWADEPQAAFDFEKALNGARWRSLLNDERAEVSPDNELRAFAYQAWRPFHPDRFWNFLQRGTQVVFRMKGFFWLATRMDEVGGLNLAGGELQCASAGHWWATQDALTRESQMPEKSRGQWRDPFGDRRQSFAVMTQGGDENTVRNQLDECLLTEKEMAPGENEWRTLIDPFPSWEHVHAHHDHDHECGHDHGSHDHDCCG
jgi:G3E family GTPase